MNNQSSDFAVKVRQELKSFLESEFDYTGQEITDDLNLAEYVYIDSINAVKIVLFIEQQYNVIFEAKDLVLSNFVNLKNLVSLVQKKVPA